MLKAPAGSYRARTRTVENRFETKSAHKTAGGIHGGKRKDEDGRGLCEHDRSTFVSTGIRAAELG